MTKRSKRRRQHDGAHELDALTPEQFDALTTEEIIAIVFGQPGLTFLKRLATGEDR